MCAVSIRHHPQSWRSTIPYIPLYSLLFLYPCGAPLSGVIFLLFPSHSMPFDSSSPGFAQDGNMIVCKLQQGTVCTPYIQTCVGGMKVNLRTVRMIHTVSATV